VTGGRALPRAWRLLLALHAAFAVAAAAAYLLTPPARGWAVLAVAVGYVAGLLAVTRSSGRRDWQAWSALLVPLSVLQVLPDWALVEIAGTLVFPDLGAPRVGGAVPLYMAALWVPPLFAVLLIARGSPWRGAVAALAVFGVAELLAPALGLWEPRGAREIGTTALYVLPAEAVLGAAVVVASRWARSVRERLVAAPVVALLYTGALFVSLLLLDRGALVVTT
jgi:hypothetical protein